MLCKGKPKDPATVRSREIERELQYEHKKQSEYIQLLLLGTGESGKTTIIKQMKIIHINGFSDEEKMERVPYIKQNIHESIYTIISNMDKINPPIELNEGIKRSFEYIMEIGEIQKGAFDDEYYDRVKLLWSDTGVQESFKRSNEYQLIDSAEHFLNRIDEIRKPDYMPTIEDILYCRITTTSISKIEFDVPVPRKYGGGKAKFWMYDVGGQRGQRSKWISVFEGINSILFLIAASDFDLKLREDETQNRLVESFKLFSEIYWSRFLTDAGMIIFLNKQDLLKRKIDSGKRLNQYFPDYTSYKLPEKEGNPNDEYEKSRHFMRDVLLDTKNKPPPNAHVSNKNRSIFVHFTIATDTKNVKLVFEGVHQIILERNLSSALL